MNLINTHPSWLYILIKNYYKWITAIESEPQHEDNNTEVPTAGAETKEQHDEQNEIERQTEEIRKRSESIKELARKSKKLREIKKVHVNMHETCKPDPLYHSCGIVWLRLPIHFTFITS